MPRNRLATLLSRPPRAVVAMLASLLLATGAAAGPALDGGWPRRLHDTGLYSDSADSAAAGSTREIRSGIVSFSPQYPLWSDGAEKRRWLALPRGTFIDGSSPDAWQFPVGTRLWKEFSYDGRPVETRVIERRADGSWSFATYIWNEDASDAELAPARGIAALPVRAAPGGRYAIPARGDCIACHGSTAVPVLGASALQLSSDRDPLAANARPASEGDVDLRALVARGLLKHLPAAVLAHPPRIAAASPAERAALGYLHANCSHCHNSSGLQVPLPLTLAQSVSDPLASLQKVLRSMVEAPSRYRPPGTSGDAQVVAPGDPAASVLAVRMRSRNPQLQMPPLGTNAPDPEGLALVYQWITHDLAQRKENSR